MSDEIWDNDVGMTRWQLEARWKAQTRLRQRRAVAQQQLRNLAVARWH